MLKTIQKDGEITEDDLSRALKNVQESTDGAITKIESIVSKKEAELLEV